MFIGLWSDEDANGVIRYSSTGLITHLYDLWAKNEPSLNQQDPWRKCALSLKQEKMENGLRYIAEAQYLMITET